METPDHLRHIGIRFRTDPIIFKDEDDTCFLYRKIGEKEIIPKDCYLYSLKEDSKTELSTVFLCGKKKAGHPLFPVLLPIRHGCLSDDFRKEGAEIVQGKESQIGADTT